MPKTGKYTFTAQVWAGEAARADVLVNAQTKARLQIAAGDQTASSTMVLNAGLNVLRVAGRQTRFDLKSFAVEAAG